MKRLLPILFLFALPLQAAGTADVQRAIGALSGLQGRFTQSYTPKGFKKAQVERGTVVFGELPRMRWTYESPEKKLFIFDGTTSWFYVPDDRQVTINTLTAAERETLPFLFLSDRATIDRSYAVVQRVSRGVVTARMTARSASTAIPQITLTFASSDYLPSRLEYSDRQGNQTIFDLGGYTRSTAGEDAFRFTPPAGTEVVRN